MNHPPLYLPLYQLFQIPHNWQQDYQVNIIRVEKAVLDNLD